MKAHRSRTTPGSFLAAALVLLGTARAPYCLAGRALARHPLYAARNLLPLLPGPGINLTEWRPAAFCMSARLAPPAAHGLMKHWRTASKHNAGLFPRTYPPREAFESDCQPVQLMLRWKIHTRATKLLKIILSPPFVSAPDLIPTQPYRASGSQNRAQSLQPTDYEGDIIFWSFVIDSGAQTRDRAERTTWVPLPPSAHASTEGELL